MGNDSCCTCDNEKSKIDFVKHLNPLTHMNMNDLLKIKSLNICESHYSQLNNEKEIELRDDFQGTPQFFNHQVCDDPLFKKVKSYYNTYKVKPNPFTNLVLENEKLNNTKKYHKRKKYIKKSSRNKHINPTNKEFQNPNSKNQSKCNNSIQLLNKTFDTKTANIKFSNYQFRNNNHCKSKKINLDNDKNKNNNFIIFQDEILELNEWKEKKNNFHDAYALVTYSTFQYFKEMNISSNEKNIIMKFPIQMIDKVNNVIFEYVEEDFKNPNKLSYCFEIILKKQYQNKMNISKISSSDFKSQIIMIKNGEQNFSQILQTNQLEINRNYQTEINLSGSQKINISSYIYQCSNEKIVVYDGMKFRKEEELTSYLQFKKMKKNQMFLQKSIKNQLNISESKKAIASSNKGADLSETEFQDRSIIFCVENYSNLKKWISLINWLIYINNKL